MANINLHKTIYSIFAQALTVGEKLVLLMFYLELLGQGRVVAKRNLHHSIANINLHNSHTERFCASSYRLRELNIFSI